MNQTPLSAMCCIGILRATHSPHLISVMLLYLARGAGIVVGESESAR